MHPERRALADIDVNAAHARISTLDGHIRLLDWVVGLNSLLIAAWFIIQMVCR